MPLFVTVAPGVQVSDNAAVDAALLNLIAQPSVSVSGSIDNGSLILSKNSIITSDITDANITRPKIETINTNSVIGKGTGGTVNAFLAASSGISTDVSNIYWKPNIVQVQATGLAFVATSYYQQDLWLWTFDSEITTTKLNSKILINANFDFYTTLDGSSIALYRTFNGIETEIGNNNTLPNSTYLRTGIATACFGSTTLSIDYIDNVINVGKYKYVWFAKLGLPDQDNLPRELRCGVGSIYKNNSNSRYTSDQITVSAPTITLEELPV